MQEGEAVTNEREDERAEYSSMLSRNYICGLIISKMQPVQEEVVQKPLQEMPQSSKEKLSAAVNSMFALPLKGDRIIMKEASNPIFTPHPVSVGVDYCKARAAFNFTKKCEKMKQKTLKTTPLHPQKAGLANFFPNDTSEPPKVFEFVSVNKQ